MNESAERIVHVGFRRRPKIIFDEVEQVAADMLRQGWHLKDTVVEEGLGSIHLFFERKITTGPVHSANREPKEDRA